MRDQLALRVARRWVRSKQQADYKKYVDDKRKKGEKPLPEDEWEAKVLGKGKKEEPKAPGGAADKWKALTKKEQPFDRRDPDKKLRFQVPFGMRDPAKGLQRAVSDAFSKAKGPKPKIDFKGLKSKIDGMKDRLDSWKAHGDEAKWKKEMQEFVSGAEAAVKDLKKQHGGLLKRLFKRGEDEMLRQWLIKLATDVPETRRHIIPLLRQGAAKTDDEKAVRKAADDLIKLGKAAGDVKVINEDEWFGGFGGSDPDNPYLTFRFERIVPGSKRRLFCDVYVRTKGGKTYYLVDPFGKKGRDTSPAKAWAMADSILWPHGHPESFDKVASDLLNAWQRKWGRIKAKKSGKEWSWTVTGEEAQQRGLRTDTQNNAGVGRPTWFYDSSTGTHYYRPDPTIQYRTFGQGAEMKYFRIFWKVMVGTKVPPSVD